MSTLTRRELLHGAGALGLGLTLGRLHFGCGQASQEAGAPAAAGLVEVPSYGDWTQLYRQHFTWDSVHPEAERLEHAASDSLIERMALTLGNPAFDPHGDPIPQPDGSMTEVESIPLTEVPPNSIVEVLRVVTSEPDRLRYLAKFGLRPGSVLYLVDRQPFRGPVTVRVGRKDRVLGHEMAALLLCRPTGGDQIG